MKGLGGVILEEPNSLSQHVIMTERPEDKTYRPLQQASKAASFHGKTTRWTAGQLQVPVLVTAMSLSGAYSDELGTQTDRSKLSWFVVRQCLVVGW